MTLISIISKLDQKLGGSPNPPPQNPHPNFNQQPPYQPYNYPNQNYPQPNYNPNPSYYQNYANYPPPQRPTVPASKKLVLSSSDGLSSTIAKDPDTKQDLYVFKFASCDNWTGESKSGLEQELRVGNSKGPIIGGFKRSQLSGKRSLCIGDPKNGGQWQKLGGSGKTKCGFVSPTDGKEYEWSEGKDEGAFVLVGKEGGEEVGSFESYGGMSMSKLGTLEIKMRGGEDWFAAAFVTFMVLQERKVGKEVGIEIFNAVVGI
ncbi:hypothetical protein TWF694_008254 [Orbilia ellipsospora]|uniref:Uncharacterized protein n=1 Tax=Orbilia ellipsospora TaxID=2528407 RepID=A0AAV9XFZ1_9PEZI